MLLVVLGTTGAVMLRMSGTQQAGSTVALLGARGNLAARSGVDWALHQAQATGSCPAAATTLNLNEGSLSGFVVTVRCTASAHREGSQERMSLSIHSEASFGSLGARDYVFREVQATLVL
ncbi:MAG: hypothetical protein CL908_06785 [Deltaproteobacteria bacterium]|nr:hypothetical protein [Deltaproteobacteria bacterium]